VITRAELADYLHGYLACDSFNDYAPNGMQIEGKETLVQICTAVTASQDVIDKAVSMQADALLVHHGYFWRGEDTVITGMKRKRIGQLIAHNINLYAYHLPLDCHPDLGNNACVAELLGLSSVEMHTVGKTKNLLWTGSLAQSLTAHELSAYLADKLKREPQLISGSERAISRIALCTGAAQDYIEDAAKLGVDAYLSGEVSERTYYQAHELGLHYYACGHHASERYGIQALGHHLSARFDLRHQFIDSANPV